MAETPTEITAFLKELICKAQERHESEFREIRQEVSRLWQQINEMRILQAESKVRLGIILGIAATVGAGISQLIFSLLKMGAKP